MTFQSISASGGHQCGVLKRDGSVVCWGANDAGQLGNGTTAFGAIPLPVMSPPTP
jgi:alpha-tubulin suppressor-like RCC1 family protein